MGLRDWLCRHLCGCVREKTFQFTCKCGTVNYITGEPEELVHKIFVCDGCGEKVLMNKYGGKGK